MFRSHRSLRFLALAGAVLVAANGCSDESSTGPSPDAAPPVPSAERMTFDFGFFQEPSSLERASKANFFNAYVRAAVAGAVTHLLLVPPVTAFSLALNTVPSPQEDGSYLWIYTYVHGAEEAQIRLRGRFISADRVEWEMRASNTLDGFVNELWFTGETWAEGDAGDLQFHDFEREGKPVVASLQWGNDVDGDFLRFVDELDHPGNSLEFREEGSRKAFTWTDLAVSAESWYVRWNEADGTGSLRAADYNGGEPACWDSRQNDTECPTE